MIVPMMDAELATIAAATSAAATTTFNNMVTTMTSLAATMAFMAPLGNGMGKLINGIVCQALGTKRSSKLYFVGSTIFSSALACLTLVAATSTSASAMGASTIWNNFLTPKYLGLFVAGIEFCASIQWTVCSTVLSQYYRSNPPAFARGITILALSSTTGQIAAKVVGACLLQYVHWRQVARLSVLMTIVGWNISTWTFRNLHHHQQQQQQTQKEENERMEIMEANKKNADHRGYKHTEIQITNNDSNINNAGLEHIVHRNNGPATSTTPTKSMAINIFDVSDAAPHLKTFEVTKDEKHQSKTVSLANKTTTTPNLRQSVTRVLGSRIFWMIGLAHVSGYLTRTSDRILGTFLQEITSLPRKYYYPWIMLYVYIYILYKVVFQLVLIYPLLYKSLTCTCNPTNQPINHPPMQQTNEQSKIYLFTRVRSTNMWRIDGIHDGRISLRFDDNV